MRRTVLLTLLNMCAAMAIVAHGAPQILVSATSLDFGDGYNGYNECRTLVVTGIDLTDDISLRLEGSSPVDYVIKGPKTITKEQAASGAEVTISFFPMNEGTRRATLVLSSPGLRDVVVALKGNGIKTSAFLIPDVTSLAFEAPVMSPVRKTVVVHRQEFDGWLAVAPFNPDIFLDPKIMATLQGGDGNFRLMGMTVCFTQTDSLVLTVCYRPLTEGAHTARICLTGFKAHPVYIDLEGTAFVPDNGDMDGSGNIDIHDVTVLIDMLLDSEDALPGYADSNGDGTVGIGDITALIDRLLSSH